VLGLDGEAACIGAPYLWGSRCGAHAKILRIPEQGGASARTESGSGTSWRWETPLTRGPVSVTPSVGPGCQRQERGESAHMACWAGLLTRAMEVNSF
jgi:hypothetical protein